MESNVTMDIKVDTDKIQAELRRDVLLMDECVYGIAFVDEHSERVAPERVFKSVANTYTDDKGRPVRLWKSETEQQAADTDNGDSPLDPVIARKHTTCHLCHEEIEPGDTIVSADGDRWVHTECGVLEGWTVT